MTVFIISYLFCVLIWFLILVIVGFMSWLKDRKRRKKTKLGYKIINRGKCMLCGKELTEGLFFCKECEQKGGKSMTAEEEMKILEEINKETIQKGRLLYSYEIKEILDQFIVEND